MTLKEYLQHCTACGGNWSLMLFTGLQRLASAGDVRAQQILAKLPENYTFVEIITAVKEYGVDI